MNNTLIDESNFDHHDPIELQGKTLWVPRPTLIPPHALVDREDIQDRVLAAWLRIGELQPMHFRLYGPPGTGKNSLVYRLASLLKRDLYLINGHQELGPEDIACSATMNSDQSIAYVASPLFAAMLRGGICFFDEIGKVPQSALDPLAPVLDDRRSLTSVVAGIRIKAQEDFLFCAALNEDEERHLGLPEFIAERTQPAIRVGNPSPEVLERMLRVRLPMVADSWFKVFLKDFSEGLSPRGAFNLLSYAYRLAHQAGENQPSARQVHGYLQKAVQDMHVKKSAVGVS